MKIAVAYENLDVLDNFEDVHKFKVYTVDDGKMISCRTIGVNGEGKDALVALLKHYDIDDLICGGLTEGVEEAAAEKDVKVHSGASGRANDAVNALLNGEL